MVAYVLLPPASTSSSLQYSLSLTEDDINSSFAVRWVLGVALGALMRNSVLIQALSAAAGGGQGKETSALRQLETANDYRLTSTKLEAKGGGLFGGAGQAQGRLVMDATALLPADPGSSGPITSPSFAFKLRASIEPQPAGSLLMTVNGPQQATSNQVIFDDPEILVCAYVYTCMHSISYMQMCCVCVCVCVCVFIHMYACMLNRSSLWTRRFL